MPAIPFLISAGTSIAGGIMGSRAAKKAGQRQGAAADRASQMQWNAFQSALPRVDQAYTQGSAAMSPYAGVGGDAAKRLSEVLGVGGDGAFSPFSLPSFSAPNIEADEGYKFVLDETKRATENSAAARGSLISGNTFAALQDRAKGLASTEAQNVFNRALQAYQANSQSALAGRQQMFNELFGLAGQGQDAAQYMGDLGLRTAGMFGDWAMGTADRQGDYLTGGEASRAAGDVGSANAWSSALSGVGNTAMDWAFMQPTGGRRVMPPPSGYGASVGGSFNPWMIPGMGGGGVSSYSPPPRPSSMPMYGGRELVFG